MYSFPDKTSIDTYGYYREPRNGLRILVLRELGLRFGQGVCPVPLLLSCLR